MNYPTANDADLDGIAWRVLSDLCRPGGEFATYPPDALQRLIGLRLAKEATRAAVPPAALAEAFERALREFTGADRPPRDLAAGRGEGPAETIDDI
ncbi:MAG: hypothetical protein ACRDJN_09595 [Chloroflexota bacterium]